MHRIVSKHHRQRTLRKPLAFQASADSSLLLRPLAPSSKQLELDASQDAKAAVCSTEPDQMGESQDQDVAPPRKPRSTKLYLD